MKMLAAQFPWHVICNLSGHPASDALGWSAASGMPIAAVSPDHKRDPQQHARVTRGARTLRSTTGFVDDATGTSR